MRPLAPSAPICRRWLNVPQVFGSMQRPCRAAGCKLRSRCRSGWLPNGRAGGRLSEIRVKTVKGHSDVQTNMTKKRLCMRKARASLPTTGRWVARPKAYGRSPSNSSSTGTEHKMIARKFIPGSGWIKSLLPTPVIPAPPWIEFEWEAFFSEAAMWTRVTAGFSHCTTGENA